MGTSFHIVEWMEADLNASFWLIIRKGWCYKNMNEKNFAEVQRMSPAYVPDHIFWLKIMHRWIVYNKINNMHFEKKIFWFMFTCMFWSGVLSFSGFVAFLSCLQVPNLKLKMYVFCTLVCVCEFSVKMTVSLTYLFLGIPQCVCG